MRQFMFFERAPDAPAAASPDQVAAIRDKPIRDLGVQEAYTAALERDTLQGYEDFLAAYPGDPLAKRVRAIVAARREAITWRRTYRTDTPDAYWSYLRRYPRGPHAADARRRLAILTAPLEPPPAFAMIDYDVPPPPPDEIVYVDRPVLAFSDPEFDFVPPPPPPVYYLPPPPPDFVVLAPPPPPIGLFILPQPLFVPIPVYVRAPVYVAPPPNNIIYTNIHNTTVINNVINRPPQAQPAPALSPGANVLPNANGAPPPPVAAAPAPGGATPTLPPAVAQKATLIQQGKLPVPPSASINPVVKPACSVHLAPRGVRRTRCGRYSGRSERYQGCAQCTAAGQCDSKRRRGSEYAAARAARLTEGERAAGARRQGGAARTAGRGRKPAERGQSECEACPAPTGISASATGNGASGPGCSERSRNRWRSEAAGRGSRAGARPAEAGCSGSGPGSQRQADGRAGSGHEAFGGSACNPAKARSRAAATAAFGRSETASAARRAPVAAASRCASGKASASATAAFGCSETASAAGRAPVAAASHCASGKTRASATAAGSGTATAAPASRGTSATTATDGGAIATAARLLHRHRRPPGWLRRRHRRPGRPRRHLRWRGRLPPPPAAAAKKCPPNVPRC